MAFRKTFPRASLIISHHPRVWVQIMRGAMLCLFLCLTGLSADDRPVREKVRDVERHMKSIIDDAEPSVVAIAVSHNPRYPGRIDPAHPGQLGGYSAPMSDFRGGGGRAVGFDPKLDLADVNNLTDHPFGTGVVIDIDGLILTNYHLIDGARKIYVRTSTGQGSYADIHAADARSDLAVLKLLNPIMGLKAMKIASGRISTGPQGEKPTISRGMWVVSLGHPRGVGFADGAASASWGILSNVRRRGMIGTEGDGRNKPISQLSMLLQTDARLTLGSSGSPLLNLDGEMIGLSVPSAAITGAETAGGFAIPMDINFRRIVERLKQGKEVEYGFLGVSFNPQRGAANQLLENGLMISDVGAGTPAADAGLVGSGSPRNFTGSGDAILAVDGNVLRDMDDLYLYVGSALAGNTVKLNVLRTNTGQKRLVDVKLAKFSHEFPFIASNRPEPVFGLRVDWSSVHQKVQGGAVLPPCVAVREIEPNSPAAKRLKSFDPDLKGAWVILNVDGQTVAKPDDFLKATAQKTSLTFRMVNLAEPNAGRTIVLP
jgi:serine protease Do